MSRYVECAQMPGKFCPRVECRFPSHNLSECGFTMIEVMVALVIISVSALAIIFGFTYLSRALVVSSDRTIANNLVQEKIEAIAIKGYDKIFPTKKSDLDSYGYDNTYYPPEVVTVKGKSFTRYVRVYKMREMGTGNLEECEPGDPDEGLKKIAGWATWDEDGSSQTVTLTTLIHNPNRSTRNSAFQGTVQVGGGGARAGATVEIIENSNWTDTSAVDGTYSVSVASGTYNLKASKRGYFSQTIGPFTIGNHEIQTGKDFTLNAIGEGAISGVVKSTGGAGIGGATVTCNDETSYLYDIVISSYVTGEFTIGHVSTGTWTIFASSGSLGLQGETPDIVVLEGATTAGWEIVLDTTVQSGSISGKVTKYDGDNPENIRVVAGIAEATCDSGGYYTITGVTAGNCNVIANYNYTDTNYTEETATCTVVAGQNTTGVDFTIIHCGSVSGQVKLGSGDPLEGVVVRAIDNLGSTRGSDISDVNGLYLIEHLPVPYNNYTVEPVIEPEDTSSPASYNVGVAKGIPKTGKDFTINPAWGTISGEVKDSGEPITTGVLIMASTGTITVEDIDSAYRSARRVYGTMSNAQGAYELSVRRGGSYQVHAWYTELSGDTPITSEKSGTADLSAADSVILNFNWP